MKRFKKKWRSKKRYKSNSGGLMKAKTKNMLIAAAVTAVAMTVSVTLRDTIAGWLSFLPKPGA